MTKPFIVAIILLAARAGPAWTDNNGDGDDGGAPQTSVHADTALNGPQGAILPFGRALPAISGNGKEVAFIVSRSEYNDSGWHELRIVSQAGLRKRIVLDTYRPAISPADSSRQATIRGKAAKKAQALLDAKKFTPLAEFRFPGGSEPDASVYEIEKRPMRAGNWLLTYQTSSRTLCVLDMKGKKLFSRQAAMKKPDYCCPQADLGEKCVVGYQNVRAWGNGNVVFVLGEYWGYPDGCEIDYHYWAIWPAKGKGHLETNQ